MSVEGSPLADISISRRRHFFARVKSENSRDSCGVSFSVSPRLQPSMALSSSPGNSHSDDDDKPFSRVPSAMSPVRLPSSLSHTEGNHNKARNSGEGTTPKPGEDGSSSWFSGRCLCIVILLLLAGAGALAAAAFLGPLLFKKVIIPLMEWEETHLSKPTLAFLGVVTMAVFPVGILPTGPSMWLLGIVFGYFWGFLLILVGGFFGQTLPYLLGHWLMHKRVQAWLSYNPQSAVLLRLADGGDWYHQFKIVLLLRFSPFPYPLFNYAVTATKISYSPYICASMIAMVPEAFIAIYCGRLLQRFVDMQNLNGPPVSPLSIAWEVLGLAVACGIVLTGMWHGRRALQELQQEQRAQEAAEAGGVEMAHGETPAASALPPLWGTDEEQGEGEGSQTGLIESVTREVSRRLWQKDDKAGHAGDGGSQSKRLLDEVTINEEGHEGDGAPGKVASSDETEARPVSFSWPVEAGAQHKVGGHNAQDEFDDDSLMTEVDLQDAPGGALGAHREEVAHSSSAKQGSQQILV